MWFFSYRVTFLLRSWRRPGAKFLQWEERKHSHLSLQRLLSVQSTSSHNYHPHNVAATKVVLSNLSILQADTTASDVFDKRHRVVYRRARNIRGILVRGWVTTNTDLGTHPWQKNRCKVLLNTPNGTSVITENFICISRKLVYAISCKRYDMVSIGKIGRTLAYRLREQLRDV